MADYAWRPWQQSSSGQWGMAGGTNPTYEVSNALVPTPQTVQYVQTMNNALGGGVGTPEYDIIKRAERDRVRGQFGDLRRGVEKSIHRRGLGRSGFAGQLMSRLGGQEGGALAEVEGGVTDRLAGYKQQQRELGIQMKMQRELKKKNDKMKKIGAGLGIAGLVLAPFTGGASLALAGAGAGMYGQNA
jgi:hypothetical protein